MTSESSGQRIEEPEPPRTPDNNSNEYSIEPGRPRLEHVVFVVLGVVGTILVFLEGLGLL